MSQISNALFTRTQQKVFGLVFGQPTKSFYTNEIIKRTGMGVATIKRELEKLSRANIITKTKIGNQLHYQANTECPVYNELVSICRKTFGLADTIHDAIEVLKNKIAWAFIFGSIASGSDVNSSDIDLMIIGDVTYSETVEALYPVQEMVQRNINPKIYTAEEWRGLFEMENGFIIQVLEKPIINVLGDGHEFR